MIFAGVETLLSVGCLLTMNVIAGVGFKVAPSNVWVYWISLYFFEDLLYYTIHFLDHHIRILWAGHVTHHSSDKFNFSVGLRTFGNTRVRCYLNNLAQNNNRKKYQ